MNHAMEVLYRRNSEFVGVLVAVFHPLAAQATVFGLDLLSRGLFELRFWAAHVERLADPGCRLNLVPALSKVTEVQVGALG